MPLWLQQGGYYTQYVGKLFNGHNTDNYDSPFAAGWDQNAFLLEPYTYQYTKPALQRGQQAPVIFPNTYSTDLIQNRTLGFIDQAVAQDKPFFLGVAPIAPHSNLVDVFTPPVPADRYKGLFPNATVPRSANFNPKDPSGAAWVTDLKRLSPENVQYIDEYYRLRLRALQSVDELVENVVQSLDNAGVLDNTFIIYTSDNGYHLGNHRMQPGKTCGYEEDVHVPFIIRGPGVPKNKVTSVVTNHIDFAPTVLKMAGIPARANFDGIPIPFSAADLQTTTRPEHVTVEFWGHVLEEGKYATDLGVFNTYKAIRIAGSTYNVYYSVWCHNEHELYDMNADVEQMNNLHGTSGTLYGRPIAQVVARLDAALLVLKTCQGDTCVHPWAALQPNDDVDSLQDALLPKYDKFYTSVHANNPVSYTECRGGYFKNVEGPQFKGAASLTRRDDGTMWHEWT